MVVCLLSDRGAKYIGITRHCYISSGGKGGRVRVTAQRYWLPDNGIGSLSDTIRNNVLVPTW